MRWIRSAHSGKTLSQKLLRVIGFGNDYTRCLDKFVQTDLEIPWRKNVVCVRGKAKSDWKKFGDPESGARSHPGEVCMNVVDSHVLQAQSDIHSLIKAKKIGAPAPLIESSNDYWTESSFF